MKTFYPLEDIENFAFNTAVSAFMICTNDLIKLGCHKKSILEKFAVILAPFAPHVAEEFWAACGSNSSVLDAEFPEWEMKYVAQDTFPCPVSLNGKMKFTLDMPRDLSKDDLQEKVMENEQVKKLIAGKEIKKIIVVPNKIVNLVVSK